MSSNKQERVIIKDSGSSLRLDVAARRSPFELVALALILLIVFSDLRSSLGLLFKSKGLGVFSVLIKVLSVIVTVGVLAGFAIVAAWFFWGRQKITLSKKGLLLTKDLLGFTRQKIIPYQNLQNMRLIVSGEIEMGSRSFSLWGEHKYSIGITHEHYLQTIISGLTEIEAMELGQELLKYLPEEFSSFHEQVIKKQF